MAIEQTTTTVITCDNPACPGNDLDPADRNAWLFVTAEVYGEPSSQHVYCCADCAGTIDTALKAEAAAKLEATPVET